MSGLPAGPRRRCTGERDLFDLAGKFDHGRRRPRNRVYPYRTRAFACASEDFGDARERRSIAPLSRACEGFLNDVHLVHARKCVRLCVVFVCVAGGDASGRPVVGGHEATGLHLSHRALRLPAGFGRSKQTRAAKAHRERRCARSLEPASKVESLMDECFALSHQTAPSSAFPSRRCWTATGRNALGSKFPSSFTRFFCREPLACGVSRKWSRKHRR